MSDKTKNILTVILWLLLLISLAWYIALAWEIKSTKDSLNAFNSTVEWIKDIDQRIADNSAKYKELEQQKKDIAQMQNELHEENQWLRQERDEQTNSFLEWLWLIESRQAQ